MAKFGVNPGALVVNREARHMSVEVASELTGIPVARIQAYERNEDKPSWGEVDKLARVYKVSTLALADPNPQPPTQPTADFRTLDGRPTIFTIEIATALEEARELQEAAAETISENPQLYRLAELPQITLDDDPAEVAAEFRRRLEISVAFQQAVSSTSNFYQLVRSRIEGLGVFVSQANMGDIQNGCRGVCLIGEAVPPLIIINSAEKTPGARLFSLMHEFSHILLGMPGVSGSEDVNVVERFCNRFSAEFLMPADLVHAVFEPPGNHREYSLNEIRLAANRVKSSQQALALRIETLGYAPRGFYDQWKVEVERLPLPRGGGAPMEYGEKKVRQLGVGLSSLFLSALNTGAISEVDAFRAMNVAPAHYGAMQHAIGEIQNRLGAEGGG